jgi:phosphoenolpyruvate---glycerone phosphotransferase subunit DhaL
MHFYEPQIRDLVTRMAEAVIAHAEELTELDQPIGDGDHGVNMKRGFAAVLDDLDHITKLALPEALAAVGKVLVMKIGGASGPLYGTFFLQLGKSLPEAPGLNDLVRASEVAVSAVKARGKSDVGCKTMLDVLVPTLEALRAAAEGPSMLQLNSMVATAEAAATATIPMRAVRGRAAFVAERSIGHLDPGARSSALLIRAACESLESMQ